MAYGTRAAFEPIREAAFGDVGAAYAALGGPFTDHARIVRIVNSTDVQVYISTDGVNDHLRMAANSFFVIDLSSNKVRDDGLFIAIGTQIYQRRVSGAPGSGAVWLEVLFAQGGV